MPSTDQITLHNLIDHQIDHLDSDSARLSDLESPISHDVATFLKDHIRLNREHSLARSATFLGSKGGAGMKSICDDLLKPRGHFVFQSQKIAELLFSSMKGDKRIHPGDLVICTFSEAGGDKWLALLKMDPQDAFISEEERINGKLRRVLKKVPHVLPSGELQKCAFILPLSLRPARNRDLVVLDLQVARYGAWQQVASFFSGEFLQCKVGLNSAEMTTAFNQISYTFAESKRGDWSDAEIEKFKEDYQTRLAAPKVRVANFAKAAIEKPEDQSAYLDTLVKRVNAASYADLDFAPDPNAVRKTEMITIEGDDGLRIRIKKSAVGKTLTVRRDEAENLHFITITTHTLKGLPKP